MRSSLIDEFETIDLKQAQSPTNFFSYCLKHQLFKEEDGFSSRMKLVF